MEDHINVAIRVRPLNQRERSSAASTLGQTPWQVQRDTITQRLHADGRACSGSSFTFDKVFDQRDSTQTVYNDIVKEIVTSSMSGFNGTIFAYGQTSSGKTHTMYGSGAELGIIKLAVKNMFDIIANDTAREYLIRVSFLEIYNEILRDLLEPTKINLKIHENAKREIYVGDLSQHFVFNADQVEAILLKGDSNRQVAGTNMNERSSRSHTIFSIIVESREKADPTAAAAAADACGTNGRDSGILPNGNQRLSTGSSFDSGEFTGAVMVSSLNLVDLAGSERVGQTGAEGQRLKEGAHINKSLLSLGTVIARLAEDGGDRGHIPYRDSKLTRILQPSLGGNAKTLIICTITPSPDYIEEALSTLKFASRAKTIQNKPEINKELRGDALLRNIERTSELELKVAQMEEVSAQSEKVKAQNEALQKKLWKSQKEQTRLQEEQDRLQKEQSRLQGKLATMESSMFSITRGNGTADASSELRRQTWYPGIHRTQSDGSPTINRSGLAHPAVAIGGLATAMDIDEDPIGEAVTIRSRSRAGLNGNSDQHSDNRSNGLELQVKTLQHQHDEAVKNNQEMSRDLERITQDYNLILSGLSQLANAADIPPSPAKAGPCNSPREMAEIRRRLRELISGLSESRKQTIKVRSQRGEAEFLEKELRSVHEALAQKEDELNLARQEAVKLRSSLAESMSSLALAEDSRLDHKKQLAEAANAKAEALREHNSVRARLEQERCGLTSSIRTLKEMMAGMENQLKSENATLQTKLDEQLSQSEQLRQRMVTLEAEQRQLHAALDGAKGATADKQGEVDTLSQDLGATRQRVSALELKLDEATAAHAAVKGACLEAEARVQQLEVEKASAVDCSAKLTELATQLKSKITATDHVVFEQREQIDALQMAATESAADRLSLQGKVDYYSQVVSELKAGASASVDAAQREIHARVDELNGLKQELDAAQLASADAASTRQRLADAEVALAQRNAELAEARAACDDLSAMRALDKEALHEHHASLEGMSEKLLAMKAELEDTVRDHSHMLTERDAQLATLRDLEGTAVERVHELEAQLDSASTQLSSMQDELAKQKESLDAELLLKAELSKQIEANAAAMPGLEADMAGLRMEMNAKLRMLSESELQRELLMKQIDEERAAAQAEALRLQSTIADRRKDVEDAELKLRDVIATLETRVQNELGRISGLQQTIETGKRSEAELREQLDLSIAEKEALAAESQALKVHVNSLLVDFGITEDKVGQMLEMAENAERAANETRQELQARVDELRAQNSHTVEEMAQLQHKCDALTSDVQRYKSLAESSTTSAGESERMLRDAESASSATIATLQTQIGGVTAERDGLLRETAAMNAQLDDAASERTNLESELDALRQKYEEISEKHTGLSSLVIELTASLESETKKYNDALAQRSEQQGQAESYTVQLDNLQSAVDDRTAELAKAREAHAAFEGKALELRQALDKMTAECARLSTQIGEEIEMRHTVSERLAAAEAKLTTATTSENQHRHRIDEFEALLSGQNSALVGLQESIAKIHSDYASAKKAALERAESLEADITNLRCELHAQHTKCDTLEKELEDSRAATNEALSASETLSGESEKLRADYEALADRSKAMQADMEQDIADVKSELSSKSAEIRALETALETANASVEAARNEARDASCASIERLEAQVAASESRAVELEATAALLRAEIERRTGLEETVASEHADLEEAVATIDRLAEERDKARQDVESLKSFVTELATTKDNEYAELEEKLMQQVELLQITTDKSSEKDELVKQLEGQAAEHLSRAVNAEVDLDRALVQNSQDIDELTTERDALEAKLTEASLTRDKLEARVKEATANGDRLQAEIKRHEQAAADLQQSLERATSSLTDADAAAAAAKQERLDLVAAVSAELSAVAKSFSALPGCAQVASIDIEATSTTSYQVLLGAIKEMTTAAVAGAAANAQAVSNAGESTQYEQDISRLQALNEKLEKKNAKLRDMYTSDTTELHAKEEEQRQRAESLAKELADSKRQVEAADGELVRVRGDLDAQCRRRMELEAMVAQREAAPPGSPAPNGKAKARLASQRTPMTQENKRAHLASASVATLSPISSSTLNSRLGVLEDPQQNGHPARKRTALGPDTGACASGAEAAVKADPLRARSNYGDRRRMRRNQQPPPANGLEEQATEQCVQQ